MSTAPTKAQAPPLAQQIPLFDAGIDIAPLRAAEEDLMSATQATNTKKAYAHSWDVFKRWCTDAGRDPLPATPETVRLFAAWCLKEKGARLATVRTHLSGVKDKHARSRMPSPVDDSVRQLLRSAARKLSERPGGSNALTPETLRRICEATLKEGGAIATRDRALMLTGFAGAFRRSELAALEISDVRFVKRGVEVSVWKSKTDQQGAGRPVGIAPGESETTCPVRALRAWLKVRGNAPGPLFLRIRKSDQITDAGISGESINETLKRWLDVIGVDASKLTAHSLRAGFVTAAGDQGASPLVIMRTTRHTNVQTVMRYLRPSEAFAQNALAGVL